MITEIEEAVAAYLDAALDEDATLTAGTWNVKAATTVTAAPKAKTLIAVAATSVTQAFPQLVDAIIQIHVITPAEPVAVAQLATLFEQAVGRAFSTIETETVEADIATEINTRLSGWDGAGIYVTGWQPGRESTNFAPHFELKVGLVKVEEEDEEEDE
jgi:hypothetical protein